jgi:hypothetical protein
VAGFVTAAHTLASELREGTIERVMDMRDLELGLQALLGNRRPGRR